MNNADRIRLQHMQDAAAEAIAFVRGRSRNDLDQNRMLVLSLVKSLEIIGEAAGRVSAKTKSENPEIPWADIVSMRHRLIHADHDVNLDVVWNTVERDLPDLSATLRKIVGEQ